MSEQGHVKNVANFGRYISYIIGYGAAYQPSNALILLPSLQAKQTDFQAAIDSVAPKASAESIAVNERQTAFDDLQKLAPRILAAADASVSDQLFSNDLRSIVRKLQGRRAAPKVKDDPNTPAVDESKQGVSASQMSYDNQIGFFAELIGLLKANADYKPNEAELKTAALEARLADLQAKNEAVITAIAEARTARTARDAMLYDNPEGVKELADLIKKYVKSLYGANSPQHKQLQALTIKKVK